MYALDVKNRPSARIFSAGSRLMKMTKPYSAICRAGVSITRYLGVSNIEMQDSVVTQIIPQSKYVARPRKLLEEIALSIRVSAKRVKFQYIDIICNKLNDNEFSHTKQQQISVSDKIL